jgi:hypothetical protein
MQALTLYGLDENERRLSTELLKATSTTAFGG